MNYADDITISVPVRQSTDTAAAEVEKWADINEMSLNFTKQNMGNVWASSRMYILRECKSYGYSKDQLNNLFNLLVMSVFLYGIEVWGAAYQRKYLDRIDWFLKRAHRFAFVTKNNYTWLN